MRLKKLTRAKKPRRAQRSPFATFVAQFASGKKGRPSVWKPAAYAMVAAVFCIGVGAMLSEAMHSGARAETTMANASTSAVTAPAPAVAAAAPWTPNASAAERPAPSEAAPQTAVTITGCLEQNDDTFRLKNTSGAEAPKSRSWKSGFLKKNSSSIEIIDVTNRVQLPSHVGQRVVVTGLLVDREMQVRSLKSVATSCNQTA
jgi:hypothetical protein